MPDRLNIQLHSNTWEEVAPMIHRRHSHGMVMAGNKIYVAGGDDVTGPLATAEVYDPATGQWSEIANMSNARFYFIVFSFIMFNANNIVCSSYLL